MQTQFELRQGPPYWLLLSTRQTSQPAALLSAAIQTAYDAKAKLDPPRWRSRREPWHAAFSAGRLGARVGTINGKGIDRAQFIQLLKKP